MGRGLSPLQWGGLASAFLLSVTPACKAPSGPGGGNLGVLQGSKATGEAPRAWDPASFPQIRARS